MEKSEMRIIEHLIDRLESLRTKNLVDQEHINSLKIQVKKTSLKDADYVTYLLEETVSHHLTVDEAISLLKRLKTITVTPRQKKAK